MLYWLKFDDNMDFPSFSEKYLERRWEQKLITHTSHPEFLKAETKLNLLPFFWEKKSISLRNSSPGESGEPICVEPILAGLKFSISGF